LTDWVDVVDCEVVRGPRVVVNPAKDAGLLRGFMEANQDVEFVMLSGLDRVGVARAFRSAELFMDFGRQPGRDRPPREAVLGGCVVAVHKAGAARSDVDVPISDDYKFSDMDEASNIMRNVLSSYPLHLSRQSHYRCCVEVQRTIFVKEVKELLRLVS